MRHLNLRIAPRSFYSRLRSARLQRLHPCTDNLFCRETQFHLMNKFVSGSIRTHFPRAAGLTRGGGNTTKICLGPRLTTCPAHSGENTAAAFNTQSQHNTTHTAAWSAAWTSHCDALITPLGSVWGCFLKWAIIGIFNVWLDFQNKSNLHTLPILWYSILWLLDWY